MAALDNRLLVMLGEMRSDVKWLVQHATELHERVLKLEAPKEQKAAVWLNLLQIALGLLPLVGALLGQLPWAKAFEIAQHASTAG